MQQHSGALHTYTHTKSTVGLNAPAAQQTPSAPASEKKQKQSSLFIPGFDTIRTIAVLLVIFSHSLTYLNYMDLGFSENLEFLAKYGVTLFFGLSGFLITYLLLHEYQTTNTVNAKFFIIRRVLRIWPLYFLLVFIAYGALPIVNNILKNGFFVSSNYWQDLLLQLTFLWNFSIGDPNEVNKIASPFWSIHVEEQFYLFYPFLFKYLVTKFKDRAIYALGGIVAAIWLARLLYSALSTQDAFFVEQAIYRWTFFRIDTMFIGAMAAFWTWKRPIKTMSRSGIYGLIAVALGLFAVYAAGEIYVKQQHFVAFSLPDLIYLNLKYPLQSIISVLLIVAIFYDRTNVTGFANPITTKYGQVSYGIYLYHSFLLLITAIIFVKLRVSGVFSLDSQPLYFLLIAFLVYPLAWVSYNYFEKPFLKLKDKFTIIKSR